MPGLFEVYDTVATLGIWKHAIIEVPIVNLPKDDLLLCMGSHARPGRNTVLLGYSGFWNPIRGSMLCCRFSCINLPGGR